MANNKLPTNESLWAINEWMVDIDNFEMYLIGEPDAAIDSLELAEPGVEFQMANRLVKNVNLLSNLDPEKSILVHMKTEGGFCVEGMAIYDAIDLCSNKVTIIDYCQSMSMTSIILQAADKRVLMPNSYFMFHEGTYGDEGTRKQVFSAIEWEKKVALKQMMNIYIHALKKRGRKFTRWSVPRIRKMLQDLMDQKEEVYLTAQEAVEWGFADEIFDGDWQKLRKYPRSLKKK